jgi:hypothetical protein
MEVALYCADALIGSNDCYSSPAAAWKFANYLADALNAETDGCE